MIRRQALTCLLGGLLAVGAAGLANAADNVRQHLAASSVIEEIKKAKAILATTRVRTVNLWVGAS